MQAYSDPTRESDPHALPNIEVFYMHESIWFGMEGDFHYDDSGWYYWYCLPGCLPDSDPVGPFDSYEAALEDAQDE